MELVMTAERFYRDGPPNGNELQDRYLTPGNPMPEKGEESDSCTMPGRSTNRTVHPAAPMLPSRRTTL